MPVLAEINKVYLGSTEANKAYLGSTLVYDQTALPPLDAYIAAVTADSPVSFWQCQEASGNLADSVNGRTATAAGSGLSYQQAGPAADVASVGMAGTGYFTVADHNDWSSSAFTMEGWVYLPSDPGAAKWMWSKATSSFYEWHAYAQTAFACDITNEANTEYLRATGGTVSYGAWHYVVQVCDGATGPLRTYVDGTQVASDSTPSGTRRSNQSYPLNFGAQGTAGIWTGRETMLAFYTSALSSARITAHYEAMTE